MTLMRVTCRTAVALLPALLFLVYQRAPYLTFVNYFVLVPWILLYTDDRRPKVSSGYFALGALLAWIGLYPQSFKYGWLAVLVMALIASLWWMPFIPALGAIHRRFHLPRTLTCAFVWVAIEWLRATLSIAHFDLYGIGYSQASFVRLIQIADLFGVYGVAFMVAAVNGLIADVWFAVRDRRGESPSGVRTVLICAAGIVAAFAAAFGYGAYRLASTPLTEGPRAAVVQPNIAHRIRNLVGVHLTQVVMTDEKVARGASDLIIWPENAIMDSIRRPGVYLDDLSWLARKKDALMLVGGYGKPAGKPGRTTNAAFLVDHEGRIRGTYEKQMLFPWSEYVPFEDLTRRWFPRVDRLHRKLTRSGWGFLPTGVPGKGMKLLTMPWHAGTAGALPFAAILCNENTYPPIAAEAGRMGARFFVNMTSEGEVGGPVQQQLLWISVLRAVENRVPYVRAGNTGISAFIDPLGRRRSVLRDERGQTIGVAGVHVDRLWLGPPGQTLYARSRDAFAKACLAATLVLLGFALLPARWGRLGARAAMVAALAMAATAPSCGRAVALGDDSRDPAEALARGRRLCEQARYSEAISELKVSCASLEACSAALDLAGQTFYRLGDYEEGADFYRQVIRRHPQLEAKASDHLGFFLVKSGEVGEGLSAYRTSVRLEPSARSHAKLGSVLVRLEDFPAAMQAYEDALRLDPSDGDLKYELASVMRSMGDLDGARLLLEEVVRTQPDHPLAWTLLGWVELMQEDQAAAAEALHRALSVSPDSLQARYLLARLALRADRGAEARRWLAEILRIEETLGRGPRED